MFKFVALLLLLVVNSEATEKKMCKDLRNCQIYFPCSFFYSLDKFDENEIKQCGENQVFNEDKQACAEPVGKEEVECLLISNLINNENMQEIMKAMELDTNSSTTASTTTTTSTKRSTSVMGRMMKKSNNQEYDDRLYAEMVKSLGEHDERRHRKSTIKQRLAVTGTRREQSAKKETDKYKAMCIVTNWSQFRQGRGRFQFEFINLDYCNHIVFSSIVVIQEEKTRKRSIRSADYEEDEEDEDYESSGESFALKPVQHNDFELYGKLQTLKSKRPSLKLILRITDDNGRTYSQLAKKAQSRASFIKNTVDYMDTHAFDGIEIDWKWPNGPSGTPDDKTNFANLLKEFRREFGSKYILGITLSPLRDRIQNAYSLLEINSNVDYANVEAFDYYGPWDKRTSLSAPLMKMDEQYLQEAFLNIDGTISFLKAMGLAANKMVLGIAAYARSYVLTNKHLTQINSPTNEKGFSGSYTKTNGILSFYEVCDWQNKGEVKEEWQAMGMMPYAYNDDGEWVCFENEASLAKKIEYVISNEMAGVSINSIDMDDFRGHSCNQGTYPLLRWSLGLLINGNHTSSENEETDEERVEPLTTTRPQRSNHVKSNSMKHPGNRFIQSRGPNDMDSDRFESRYNGRPKLAPFNSRSTVTTTTTTTSTTTTTTTTTTSTTTKSTTTRPPYILITPPSLRSPGYDNNPENLMQADITHMQLDAIYSKFPHLKDELQGLRLGQDQIDRIMGHLNIPDPQFTSPTTRPTTTTTTMAMMMTYDTTPRFIMQMLASVTPSGLGYGRNIGSYLFSTTPAAPRLNQMLPSLSVVTKSPLAGLDPEFALLFSQLGLGNALGSLLAGSTTASTTTTTTTTSTTRSAEEEKLRKDLESQEWQLGQLKHHEQEQLLRNLQLFHQRQNEQYLLQSQLLEQQQKRTRQTEASTTTTTRMPDPVTPPNDKSSLLDILKLAGLLPGLTTSPPQDTRCDAKKDGIYRDEMECSSFYICETAENLHRVHKFTCPAGLVFSMLDCTCDWPKPELPCVTPLLDSFCKETGPSKEDTANAAAAKDEEQTKHSIFLLNQILASIPFSCHGKQIGLHRDALDCSKFYYCQALASKAEIQKNEFYCPNGLHFNTRICQCDWPANSGCTNNNLNGGVLISSVFCVGSNNLI